MSLDLGQLVIELVGDYSQLQRDIEMAKQQALKQAAELEKIYTISPSLDIKSLQATADLDGISAGKSLAQGIEKTLNSYKFSNTNFKKAGESIAQGLVAGMKSGDSEIKTASARMAGLIIDETKTKLKIKSPSKVFEEIGGEIVAGLSAGIGAGGALSISGFIQGIIADAKSAVASAIGFAGESVTKYSDFKATEAQLTSLTGSTAKATESLKFLRAEADKLALPFLDSTKAYASLVAATNNTKLAPATKDIFDGFSSGARAAQLSTADYNGAFLGLIQSITKGKETTQDFRQISDRIPQAMGIAAKSIGVTNAEFVKLLESGELTSTVFIPAFTKALGEASTTTLATATDTSTASLTRLNNRLDELKIALGAAIEPAFTAGLGFIEQTLSELATTGLFDDLNKGAKDFSDYLKANPAIAKETAAAIKELSQSALSALVTQSKSLLEYLKQNPNAIHDATKAAGDFAKGIGNAVSFAQQLLTTFKSVSDAVDEAYTKASKLLGGDSNGQDRFKNFLRYGPISLIPGIPGFSGSKNSSNIDSAASFIKNPVIDNPFTISQSVGSKILPVRSYFDLTRHHPSAGEETGRDYDKVAGQLEEVRRTSLGELVKKDLILSNAQGSSKVDVPAPVSGYARTSKDYGKFALYDQPTGGNLLAQVLHLDPSTFKFKDGVFVRYGEPVGVQGGTGAGGKLNAYGTHSHVETNIEQYKRYVQDLLDGVFDGVATNNRQTVKQSAQAYANPTQPTVKDGWMKTIASTYGAGDGTDGGPTASGRTFHANELTAAINENLKKNLGVKWGDKVEALNPANGKSVVVTITDSGPYEKVGGKFVPHSTRGFDLSTEAAKEIGISLGEVAFRVLGKNTPSNVVSNAVASQSQPLAPGQQPPEIRSILQGQAFKDEAKRREAFRKAASETQSILRQAQDLDYSSIKSPSLDDRQADEARKLQQRYDDELKNTAQRREDAQSRIGINTARLGSGSVPEAEANDLKLQIDLDKKSVVELDGVIKQLSVSRAKATAELQKFQAQQTATRLRGLNFESMAGDISIVQAQIATLKQLQQIAPNSQKLDQLPDLERELALKQNQLTLNRQLADITDRENRNDINPEEATAKLLQLRQENDLLVDNINAQYKAAEATRTLVKAKNELSTIVRENTSQADSLKLSAQLKSYGIGDGDRLAMERDAAGLEMRSKYAQDKVSLLERSQLEQLTPEQTNGERLRLALRFSQENLLNNAQYQRSAKDESASNNRYVNQTGIDLLSARSDLLQGVGLDYSSKLIQKQIAVLNQSLSFSNAIAELEKLKETTNLTSDQFTAAKANLESINDIKLESINSQFSDFAETIKGVQTDTQNVFKDLILNTQDLGDSLKKVLQDLLNNLANMASQQLSDQLFSGLLGGKANKSWQDNNSGGFGQILSSIGNLFGSVGSGGADYSSFLGNGSSTDSFSFLGGFASGGMVGDIAKSMNRERALSGNKAHLIVANDGERVLTPAEAQMWNRLQSVGRLPSYADGGIVGASGGVRVINGVNSGDSSVNVGGITVMVGGSASDVNVPQLQKVLEAQIQKTIKQERRPGGSLTRGNPYDR